MEKDYPDLTLKEFTSRLSSAEPVPGGGGAAALAGAVGAALGGMVGSLTLGKKKYASVQTEIESLKAECDELRDRLLKGIAEDAEGFAPLSRAYGLPAGEPGREEVLQDAAAEACRVPLRIMELCARAIDAASVLAEKGSRLAVSDAGCAAVVLGAALKAAALNVFINTKIIKNDSISGPLNSKCTGLLEEYGKKSEEIYSGVMSGLLH